MTVAYRLMYRLGIKPWEQGGVADPFLVKLLDREEQRRTPPYGRALDVGCGTGLNTLELARRGWSTVGVDQVERALDQARSRPATGTVSFVHGDATDLRAAEVGDGFELVLDRGCFHGLDDRQRAAVARGVTALTTPDAVLLMFAFNASRRPPFMPPGADPVDIERAYAGWSMTAVHELGAEALPVPLRRLGLLPRWMRLERS